MFNLTNTINSNKLKNMSFHPGLDETNSNSGSLKYNALSDETMEELKELSQKAKALNEKLFKYIDIKDSELEDLQLPKEYLEYRLTKHDLLKHLDPIIIANLNLACKDNVNRNELTKWVLLGLNVRLAKRVIDLSVIECEEFEIHPSIKGAIDCLKNYNRHLEHHVNSLRNISLLYEDDIEKLSSEELRERMDHYTAGNLKITFNCPEKEEAAFRWVLRGMPLLAAIDKIFIDEGMK